MLRTIRHMWKGESGFTLLEMGTVSVIIAALAAIVAVAVTGAAGDSRTSTKTADMKNVDTAVARYDNDNSAAPIDESTEPDTRVAGQGDSDVIKIVFDTTVSDFGTGSLPSGAGVVTCSTTATTSMAAAVDDCLGTVDFGLLIPDYLAGDPKHSDDDAKESDGSLVIYDDSLSTADVSFVNCTQSGETCELYFADIGTDVTDNGDSTYTMAADALGVWNVDKVLGLVTLKGNSDYGK